LLGSGPDATNSPPAPSPLVCGKPTEPRPPLPAPGPRSSSNRRPPRVPREYVSQAEPPCGPPPRPQVFPCPPCRPAPEYRGPFGVFFSTPGLPLAGGRHLLPFPPIHGKATWQGEIGLFPRQNRKTGAPTPTLVGQLLKWSGLFPKKGLAPRFVIARRVPFPGGCPLLHMVLQPAPAGPDSHRPSIPLGSFPFRRPTIWLTPRCPPEFRDFERAGPERGRKCPCHTNGSSGPGRTRKGTVDNPPAGPLPLGTPCSAIPHNQKTGPTAERPPWSHPPRTPFFSVPTHPRANSNQSLPCACRWIPLIPGSQSGAWASTQRCVAGPLIGCTTKIISPTFPRNNKSVPAPSPPPLPPTKPP